jgi:hypothetical protein
VDFDFYNTKDLKNIRMKSENRVNYYFVKIVHDKNNVCYGLTNDKKLYSIEKN